jgi:hypothetical protein
VPTEKQVEYDGKSLTTPAFIDYNAPMERLELTVKYLPKEFSPEL